MGSINDTQNLDFWDEAKKVFLPFTPIKLVELFHGRRKEINRVTSALDLPGRHVVLFGDRGVGKTSLANLILFFANWKDDAIFTYSCGAIDTFESIFDSVFKYLGTGLIERDCTIVKTGSFGLEKLGLQMSSQKTLEQIANFRVDANSVFNVLKDAKVLVILDEFDRVSSDDTKLAISELVKKLSDAEAESKLVIVGVAKTIIELIGKHPSAVRAFEQVDMCRMEDYEIEEILKCGFKRISLPIDASLVTKVARIADGYPHFAHLVGLRLVESALARLLEHSGKPIRVEETDYLPAIKEAIDGSMGSLKEAFIQGTETPAVKTQLYRWILEGIAVQECIEVSVQEILDFINKVEPQKVAKAQAISTHLGKLVDPEKRGVLERSRKGYYKFRDPMLRAYIRMHVAKEVLTDRPVYRQLQLPFA